MTDKALKILEITKRIAAGTNEGFAGERTPDNVYEYLYQNAVRARENLSANNKLLNEWLYPMLRNVNNITPEKAEELFELAQQLFQPSKSLDIELAAAIYSALTDYARSAGDIDLLIKSLYWSALSLYYMDKSLFQEEVLSRFKEAAEFRHKYTEIKNFETRRYINRSLGNIFVAHSAEKQRDGPHACLKAMDEAREFWENTEIRSFDPDMPWDLFIYAIHQNTCPMLTLLRNDENIVEGLPERVYESALFMNEYAVQHYSGTQSAQVGSRLNYYLICAEYHTKRITAREAGERLLEMVRTVDPDDYSLDAVNRMTHTGVAAFFYLGLDPDADKSEIERLEKEHYKKVVEYCAKIPNGVSQLTVDGMVGSFITSISTNIDKDMFIDIIMKLTIYRHMPSYVHALMVSWLGELITAYMCDNKPDFFIGSAGIKTVEDVRDRREEIINTARFGGLCHDIGKIMCINVVATYGRKLSSREFAIVQCHPDNGYELLKDSECKGIADIARGHHKWYDGTKGYPSNYDNRRSEYRPIVDIISVCNAIDTSTDILSRPHAVGLTRREIVNQIKAMSGSKYSPDIASALTDPELIKGIDHILTVKRSEAYFTAYNSLYPGK